MNLEQSLALQRYFHSLFGVTSLEQLKGVLHEQQEGVAGDGETFFYKALMGKQGVTISAEKLKEYDAHIVTYQNRLAYNRTDFTQFRYFQYLGLLYMEIYLDRLTENPAGFQAELNAFLQAQKLREQLLQGVQPFDETDMRRIAFFMATGSGKTLLLHVNLWQLHHYLSDGKHPDALVQRSDGQRTFRNILLVTPSEGLTRQHLSEFHMSGIPAVDLLEASSEDARVKVIDINKLVEEASGTGVTIPLASLGSDNLIFVDEGHKGTGSEAQTWKSRQKTLSENGFLVEYSATFAQAIAAANAKNQADLYSEYGKAILFDYSYRHFYSDGYGKNFRVLNLERGDESHAHNLLMGGLLIFFNQTELFHTQRDVLRPYNIAEPLWVFIGSSVKAKAVFTENGRTKSDVATVVDFLRHILDDPDWAVAAIRDILNGESGFQDADTHGDLFAPYLANTFQHRSAEEIYERIVRRLFHGHGALEVWELKNADGELGLRVSTPEGKGSPYFAVISIGDVPTFKNHLRDRLGIHTQEDNFTRSLFETIERPSSGINMLIGAKKFIEGWNSWRVSTMGLLNIGKGEGSQVIQLFGRGVRLKGKGNSLKRSEFITQVDPHPAFLPQLETLYLFGWNADYVKRFQENIRSEGLVSSEFLAPVDAMTPWPVLPVPMPQIQYDVRRETWTLDSTGPEVKIDLSPRISVLAGLNAANTNTGLSRRVDFAGSNLALLDLAALYRDLVVYKQQKGYHNLYLPPDVLPAILQTRCSAILPAADLRLPERIFQAAQKTLRIYMDRFVARKEREAQSKHLTVGQLQPDHPNVVTQYIITIADETLLPRIKEIWDNRNLRLTGGLEPLPRLFFDRHLYNPLLKDPHTDQMHISPTHLNIREARFVEDLRTFWQANHNRPPFNTLEIFLLRNRPNVGLGFYNRSGFYPDFILWMKETATNSCRLVFVEPHGMHHEGLFGANADKIEALQTLPVVSQTEEFQKARVSLRGYLLTDTPKDQIPGAEALSWDVLRTDYNLMEHDTGRRYMETLFNLENS